MDHLLIWFLLIHQIAVFSSLHMVATVKASCDEKIVARYGQFTTPNYPNEYPNDINCKWNITVPNGYLIQLNFTQFEIESTNYCTFDYVKVKGKNKMLGPYCGRRNRKNEPDVTVPPLDPLLGDDNSLLVELHTDHSNEVEVHGFEAHFTAIDVDECLKDNGGCKHFCHNFIGGFYCSCRMGYKLGNDNKSCVVQCQKIHLQKAFGTIESPDYPSNYPPNAACDWHITSEPGYFVNIEFLDFHIEEHHQSVCPYDKLLIEDEKMKKGPYCGKQSPKKFRAASNWLIVEFFSDSSEGHKGFQAKYWLEPVKCGKPLVPDFGYMVNGVNFTFKERITYKCEPGYHYIGGTTSRTCQNDGTWSGTLGSCQRISCPEPINKNSAVIMSSHGPNYYFNDTVKVSCPDFYDTYGSKEMVCQADGTWSGGDTLCIKTCGKSIRKYETIENCTNGRYRAKSFRMFQPWLVAIKESGKLICSGALISKDWVLTAGHCIADASERYGSKGNLELVLGAFHWDRLDEGSVTRKVKRAIMFRTFDYGFHSDVTLLQLSEPIENMNQHIQPICLPSDRMHRHMFRSGKNVATIGWHQNPKKPTYMTDRCVNIIGKTKCTDHIKATHRNIHKKRYGAEDARLNLYPSDIICTDATRGSNDLCGIHPGSPLVAFDKTARKWYLGGIHTWGSKEHKYCKEYIHTYDMFSKVNKYIKWIRTETRLNLKNPDVQNSRVK